MVPFGSLDSSPETVDGLAGARLCRQHAAARLTWVEEVIAHRSNPLRNVGNIYLSNYRGSAMARPTPAGTSAYRTILTHLSSLDILYPLDPLKDTLYTSILPEI